MQKRILSFLLFLLPGFTAFSQSADSVMNLDDIPVKASMPLFLLPSSASLIDVKQMQYHSGLSFVPVLNTVPGVRMEERSPGSYRLSIRGSLLRSPFGIRNIKIYVDEFPLTDAGGNTYLNSYDINAFRQIEVFRGPDGSLFGANSGGVIIVRPWNEDTLNRISLETGGGSYGLFFQRVEAKVYSERNSFQVNQSYQRCAGYRENSAFSRFYGQLTDRFRYAEHNEFRFFVSYSGLQYQTPGGLNMTQFLADPQQARPATAVFPGAAEQQAGVRNRSVFGGALHEMKFTSRLKHLVAFYGSYADFENPFITNYEERQESTFGLRTYIELTGGNTVKSSWKYDAGFEWQQTGAFITNYENLGGEKGSLLKSDRVLSRQHFFFTRFTAFLWNRLTLESAISLNQYNYIFNSDDHLRSNFSPQWMPRVGISLKCFSFLSLRASVSRGYSPPTIAEIRPSDNKVYTTLRPETGWNYELGLRIQTKNGSFKADISGFYYHLQQAIVRRLHGDGSEYFVNAGGTHQPGMESAITYRWESKSNRFFIQSLQCYNAFSFHYFTFNHYQVDTADYSGNRLTGVPGQVIITNLSVEFLKGFYLFLQHNYTAAIPLNDANTVYAGPYHLVQLKAGWKRTSAPFFELYAGIDNLLNQRYSLGNDLNAPAGRFYNAAAPLNFYAGMKIGLL